MEVNLTALPDAIAVYQDLAKSTNATERAWAHVGLGYTSHGAREYAEQEEMALAEKPHFAMALADLGAAEGTLDHEAEAVSISRQFTRDRRAIDHDISLPEREPLIALAASESDFFSGNLGQALRDLALPPTAPRDLLNLSQALRSEVLVLQHSTAAALIQMDRLPPSMNLGGRAMLATLSKNPSAVELWRRAIVGDKKAGDDPDNILRNDTPWLVIALAQTGAAKEAKTLSDSTPMDCDLCLRSRGIAASFAGDRMGAERWFKFAVARTPDLPWAYVARGQARFRAGDLDGALEDARAAVRVSPRFADGYGLWGDVLARRRQWREARDRYDDALHYAPSWSTAHLARDEVARRT